MFWVFIHQPSSHHLVIPHKQATFETQQNIQRAGFTLLWDSAPTEFDGAAYAAEHYGCPVPVQVTVID